MISGGLGTALRSPFYDTGVESETGVRVQFFCAAATVCARKVRKKLYSDPGFSRRGWRVRAVDDERNNGAQRCVTNDSLVRSAFFSSVSVCAAVAAEVEFSASP